MRIRLLRTDNFTRKIVQSNEVPNVEAFLK